MTELTSPLLSVSSISSSTSSSSSSSFGTTTTNLNVATTSLLSANSTRFNVGVSSPSTSTTSRMSLQSILLPSNEDPMSRRHIYRHDHQGYRAITPPPFSPSPLTPPLLRGR